jgi:choline kinase
MSAPIDTAVILAAGRGNRIAAVGNIPKPLLPLSGVTGEETFLDFHLEQLARAGVRHIVLVGNERTYATPLQAIRRLPSSVRVSWVKNPTEDLSTSGSAHSLQFAWHSPLNLLAAGQRVLFMDADIVYGPRALAALTDAPAQRSVTLVAPRVAKDSEEVVVFAEEHAQTRAVRHGKGLHGTELVAGLVPVGEATGMVLVAAGDHALLRGATDWVIGYSTAKARSEHEDVTQLLMALGRVDVVTLPHDEPFMEVDTPADYQRLTGHMWPLLRRSLATDSA